MGKKALFIFSIFLFCLHTVSYSQNNFKRNYIGVQPGLIISKENGHPGNSLSSSSKFFSVIGGQIGITYKYFSRSRFMFGCDLNLSRSGSKNVSTYTTIVDNYKLYYDLTVTNQDHYYCIDLPQYVGYSIVKSHNFCFSLYMGAMPRIFLAETENRSSNYAGTDFNYDKSMVLGNRFLVDGLAGLSLDFKLTEKLALEISPKCSYGFSKAVSASNIYLPVSIIRSIK